MTLDPVCDHRSFTHGVPASGILPKDCIDNGRRKSGAQAEFEAQGVLRPGEEGWWKVWGAALRHVRPGDLVATIVDGEVAYDLIEDTFEAKAAPVRVGFVIDGKRVTFGALCPIVLFRRGTRNTLAEDLR